MGVESSGRIMQYSVLSTQYRLWYSIGHFHGQCPYSLSAAGAYGDCPIRERAIPQRGRGRVR